MNSRGRLYLAGAVAASTSYIFNVLAFTGGFAIVEWAVFVALFFLVFVGFEKFVVWAETTDSD